MKSLQTLPPDLVRTRGMALVLTPGKAHKGCTDLIASLIMNGPLFVVAASEWLPAYKLTRMIRHKTTEVKKTLKRLNSARASTCYRLFDSLANLPSQGEPVLVLDLFHTFYDDDIPLSVRLFKLRQCGQELKRLAFYRPVIVMAEQMLVDDYESFISIISPLAKNTFLLAPEVELIRQPTLL